MVPWLSDIDGFDGLVMLSDEATATTLVLTFWRDREVAERHRTARMRFRDKVTAAAAVEVVETVGYDVSFAHRAAAGRARRVIPSGSGLIGGEGAVFARLHTIETTKEQYEARLEIIQNMVPALGAREKSEPAA